MPGLLDGERVFLLDDGHCFRDQALHLCARAGAKESGFRAPGSGRTLALAWRRGSALRAPLARIAATIRASLGSSKSEI